MQIRKSTKKINKPTLIVTAALLVGLVALLTYVLILKPRNDESSNTTKSDTKSSSQQQTQSPASNDEGKTEAPNTDIPAEPTTTPDSDRKVVQMIASVDQSDNTVFIRGGVNYPVTGGNCYALLSGPSGQSIRKDSEVLPNPASTDCKTISIPINELSPGKWTFTLNYLSDQYKGVSIEVPFTI